MKQGGSLTREISFPAAETGKNAEAKVRIQVLDDATYTANVKAGKNGFEEGTPTEYIVWVEQIQANAEAAQMLTAEAAIDGGRTGDWYPGFAPNRYSYSIVVPNGVSKGTLKYTVAEGATVKVGNVEQTPVDENGTKVYSLDLTTTQKTITVTDAAGTISNDYKFKLQAKSKYDVPDKVVDYLCIGSQYSNGGYGTSPEGTLSGSLKSLGNFGGYITYYYDDPLTIIRIICTESISMCMETPSQMAEVLQNRARFMYLKMERTGTHWQVRNIMKTRRSGTIPSPIQRAMTARHTGRTTRAMS